MNKSLEALKSLGEHHCFLMQKCESEECNIPCYECKYLKKEKFIEKELKALEIIKNKRVDYYQDIIESWSYEEYLDNFTYQQSIGNWKEKYQLIQEEYDLLKEVMKNE